MEVGLFFGSFNPIHMGHLIIANTALASTNCKQIWFVVSPQNPFKKSSTLLHEFDRIDMVEAAINDNYSFRTSDVEFNMPKPSFTIDTLTYLSEQHPDKKFHLIIGSDNLQSFPKWKNYEQILANFGLIVYPRPGSKESELMDHKAVKQIDAPLLDISATFIRGCIKNNRSIKYLVPDAVEQIIADKKFYL